MKLSAAANHRLQPLELFGGFLAVPADLGADVVVRVDHFLRPDAQAAHHAGAPSEGGHDREEPVVAPWGRDASSAPTERPMERIRTRIESPWSVAGEF